MTNILELFPQPVLQVDNVCVNEIPKFIEIIDDVMDKKGIASSPYQHVESTHSTFDNFFEIKQFDPLVKELQNNIYDFSKTLGLDDSTIRKMMLTQLWANRVNQNDYLWPHIHSNSFISGSYYLQASDNDYLEFLNNVNDTSFYNDSETYLNQRIHRIKCVPGRLLLFKSNMLHGSTRKIDEISKYSMSFNVVIKN